MAISEKQKQKKLLKKKQKKTAEVKAARTFISVSPASCVGYPIYESVVADNLFSLGLGEVFLSRRLPNGQLAVSAFIVDVYCLGVKNSFFRVMPEDEYDVMKLRAQDNDRYFETIHQSCAKKLLEGAVEYAKKLGINAHPDYKKSMVLFGEIDSGVCPVHYEYGKDGKPFYIRGPRETISEAKRLVDKLHEKCGEGGFNYLLMMGDDGFTM